MHLVALSAGWVLFCGIAGGGLLGAPQPEGGSGVRACERRCNVMS